MLKIVSMKIMTMTRRKMYGNIIYLSELKLRFTRAVCERTEVRPQTPTLVNYLTS